MQPDQTPEAAEPTFGTLPGIESVNGVYAGYDCGDMEADHLAMKGESLDGIMGWEDEAVNG